MTHHLVGAAEVARILGVTRQRVAQLAVTDGFPAPEVVISAGRIWSRHAIEGWAAANPERGQGKAIDDQGWAMHRLQKLASEEAEALGHGHLGVEHVVLAMLRPECPGVARQVLESFGLRHEEVGARVIESVGPPDPEAHGQTWTPRLQVMLERAKLQAEKLADPIVTSEHFLLAITDGEVHWALGDEPTSDAVRERVLALSDASTRHEEPDAEFVRRRAKTADQKRIKGSHPLPSYLTRSDGVDPTERRPWGSMLWAAEPWHQPGMPVQYRIDRDDVPVLGPTGRPFAFAADDEGYFILDDELFITEEEFDVPEEGWLAWPDGFRPPPGAHQSVVDAHARRHA